MCFGYKKEVAFFLLEVFIVIVICSHNLNDQTLQAYTFIFLPKFCCWRVLFFEVPT